jgi:hypothetical protein
VAERTWRVAAVAGSARRRTSVRARKDAKESVSEDAYHASGMLQLDQHE